MNVRELARKLVDLLNAGHGDQELVAYKQTEGEPLEVLDVQYDERLDEVSITIDD